MEKRFFGILLAIGVLLVSLSLVGCGYDGGGEGSGSGAANSDTETDVLTVASELLMNSEIAAMLPYEVSISLLGELVLIETFFENTELLYFEQSIIEYFDGADWLVVVDLKEKFPIGMDYQIMDVGVASGRRTYEFSWIKDAGFDIDNGLFRIRQRWSSASDFPAEKTHDLAIEFSLEDVGTVIRNLDIVGDLKVNPDFDEVVLAVDFSADGTMLVGTIINYSDTVISPSHPSLEYFNGVEWRYVATDGYLGFEDIGFSIDPGAEHEFSVDLGWYVIPEGYLLRLRKTVWPDGEWPYGWNQTYLHHDLVYEFEMTNDMTSFEDNIPDELPVLYLEFLSDSERVRAIGLGASWCVQLLCIFFTG